MADKGACSRGAAVTSKHAKAFQHLPLFDETQPWQTDIYRRRIALNVLVGAHPEHFRKDFADWLEKNAHVWDAFKHQADLIWDRGRRRYSARTIGEYLRHESNLREAQNEHGWKLNDHVWPDCARLYMLPNPERDGFFETRVSPTSLRAI
jgi:hypothetical protein